MKTDHIDRLIGTDHQLAVRLHQASGQTPADFHVEDDGQAVTKGTLVGRIDFMGNPCVLSTVNDFLKTKAIADETRSSAGLPRSPQAAGPEELAVCRTLCGNLSVNFGQNSGGEDCEWRIVNPDTHFESYARWNRLVGDAPAQCLADKAVLENALLANTFGRRFMRTESGRIGFVPDKS